MKYTIRDGVAHPFSERVKANFRYLLPLLVILAGVLVFTLNQHNQRQPNKPVTLGIYSIKSNDGKPDNKKPSTDARGSSGTGSASGAIVGTGTPTVSPIRPSISSLSTTSSPSTTTGVVGGMGGGLTGGGSTTGGGSPGGSGGGSTGSTVPTTTSCVDKLTGQALVCVFPYQTCTVPLSGITGYKTVDGTCIVVN